MMYACLSNLYCTFQLGRRIKAWTSFVRGRGEDLGPQGCTHVGEHVSCRTGSPQAGVELEHGHLHLAAELAGNTRTPAV